MRFGVVTFPGSCDDRDARAAVEHVGGEAVALWHGDDRPPSVDALIIPGGFSYGDYLRCGAIARFSPVMDAVRRFAAAGGPVLGICNGFQVLCEAGLLPGALLRNAGLRFVCRPVRLRVETTATPWTGACQPGQELVIPVKHGEGRYVHPDPDRLAGEGQVVFSYAPGENPNGSLADVAGVRNPAGNVVGLMPHPEHAVDPLLGPTGGRVLFDSVLAGGSGGLKSEAGAQVVGGHAKPSGSPPVNRGSGGLKSEAGAHVAGGHLEPSVSLPVDHGGEAAVRSGAAP